MIKDLPIRVCNSVSNIIVAVAGCPCLVLGLTALHLEEGTE